MSELGSLQRTLGSMHSWPQDILRYLLLVAPTPYTLLELAAFFFGNGIPLLRATDFLLECFSPSQDHIDFFRSKYDLWERCHDTPHTRIYEYYDMSNCLVVELRGAEYRDLCVIVESCIPIKLGFGVDVFPSSVRRKLDDMRAV